jgi:ABC-type multidrug transport system fused ATPase/permease subunit
MTCAPLAWGRRMNNNNFFRFIGYVKPYWKILLLGIIGGVVKFTVPLLAPQVTRYLLDDVFLNSSMDTAEKTHQIFLYGGGLIAIYAFVWTPWTYVRHYFTAKAGQKSVFDLRCDLYDHILRMSASFFNRNRSGSIVSRLISDIALAQNLVGSALTNVWMDLISLIVILYFMFNIDVSSTFVALATFPFYVLVIKKLGGRIRRTTHQVQEEIATLSGNVQEKIQGNVIVHAFTQENKEQLDFLQQSNRLFGMSMQQAFYQSLNVTINGFLVGIAPLIVTIYCGLQVISGRLSVGDMVALNLYLSPLYLPVQRFSELNVIFANSMAAIDRIFEVIDQKPEIRNKPDAVPLVNFSGKVEFDHLCFVYPDAPEGETGPVLKDITFTVEPGQRVALVGHSGSGKSTLISMIPRFYDPQSGAVRVDGQDVRDLELKSLRREVGMVLQDAVLFSGTILDNLLYGNPSANQDEVIAAAQAANAYDFIQSLPNGFYTEVGEGGSFLSGGQKQRLTIARAFLKNPRVLILDEATAALDAEAEALVKEALDKLMANRTTFIIAHRLSTVINADTIFVMEAGHIVERGSHEDLLRQRGIYHHLYTQQFESAGTSLGILDHLAPESR